jgi:hypothetical protein
VGVSEEDGRGATLVVGVGEGYGHLFFPFRSLFLFDLVLCFGGGMFWLVIVVVDTLAKMGRR